MIKKQIIELRNIIFKFKNSIFGNKNYQKFIIITRSRTGSNLLISFLNSHPNIIAKGELFGKLEGRSSKKIWDDIFCSRPKNIKYVGFKIFYYHPQDSNSRDVWNYIKDDSDISIIHLTRENMLRTAISKQIANKTNSWSKRNDKKKVKLIDKQINIDFNYYLDEFELTKKYENYVKEKFMRNRFIEITYENLTGDNQKTMNEIFDFLEINTAKVNSNFKKQNNEKLSDLILNYDEFTKRLKKTKFSYLLDFEN